MERQVLQQVKDIIRAHLADDRFSVEELSQKVAISKPQLYRKLIDACGQSANHLIRDMRIEEAKSLLENENLTITDVAYHSGYSDPDYFGKVFKKAVGVRPSEYKSRYQ